MTRLLNAWARSWRRSQCSSSACRPSLDPLLLELEWWSLPSPSLLQQDTPFTQLPQNSHSYLRLAYLCFWVTRLGQNPFCTCQSLTVINTGKPLGCLSYQVLITVNTWLTRSPQIDIHYCCSVLARSSLDGKKEREATFKWVHLQSPRPRWAGPSPFSGPGCDWCPRRWRLPLPSPCQLWSDQESLHNKDMESTIKSTSFKLCSDITIKDQPRLVSIDLTL